jgi:hypothetical protein
LQRLRAEGELPEGQEKLAWATPPEILRLRFFPAASAAGTLRGFYRLCFIVSAMDAVPMIRFASNGKRYLYDILSAKKDSTNASDLLKLEAGSVSLSAATRRTVICVSILAQPDKKSNTQFSTKSNPGCELSRKQKDL